MSKDFRVAQSFRGFAVGQESSGDVTGVLDFQVKHGRVHLHLVGMPRIGILPPTMSKISRAVPSPPQRERGPHRVPHVRGCGPGVVRRCRNWGRFHERVQNAMPLENEFLAKLAMAGEDIDIGGRECHPYQRPLRALGCDRTSATAPRLFDDLRPVGSLQSDLAPHPRNGIDDDPETDLARAAAVVQQRVATPRRRRPGRVHKAVKLRYKPKNAFSRRFRPLRRVR